MATYKVHVINTRAVYQDIEVTASSESEAEEKALASIDDNAWEDGDLEEPEAEEAELIDGEDEDPSCVKCGHLKSRHEGTHCGDDCRCSFEE
jgi:hypothetical protein